MPYQVVTERCGKWWHFFWAGPNLYINLVDLGEDVSPEYCDFAQPGNLLELRKGSVPIACVPLVYRTGENTWAGQLGLYRRPDRLAKALVKAVEKWPYGCKWRYLPFGGAPPSVLDVELLEEALRRMPILRPTPEELAVDFVVWSFSHPADFLRSEYIYKLRAKRASEKWREICPHEDPRTCYPGAVGELLADIRARGVVPAVDSILFGARYARPWGAAPVYLRTAGKTTRIYYVLGHLLREALPRMRERADSELPLLAPDFAPIDVQGPMLRKARKRKPEPLAPIEPVEDFPTGQDDTRGGPLAAFDLLDL